MDVNIEKLIKDVPGLKITENKVVCTWTGHEMPCRQEVIESYIQGKKYKKARDQHQDNLQDKYKEHLVPSTKKGHERQLFCKLTLRHLNKDPLHIKRHVEGRRFKKALARWEECQKTGQDFKARPRMSRRQRMDSLDSNSSVGRKMTSMGLGAEESGGESDAESVDSMSDLYPAADFAVDSEQEDENQSAAAAADDQADSDFDVDAMEVDSVQSTSATNGDKDRPQSGKRKSDQMGHFAKKKRNPEHRPPKSVKHKVKRTKTS